MSKNIKKYAAVITLGCRLNQTDTAIIFEELKKAGFSIVKPDEEYPLSLVIINTCSVTSSASQKSRQTVRSIKAKHQEAYIIVTGCSTETDKNWQKEKLVDKIIPNKDKTRVIEYIRNNPKFHMSENEGSMENTDNKTESFTENSIGYYPFKQRANIKIQDGCDAFCTYCIVPYGRGKPRSREWNNAIFEFKELVKRGYKEIVLTGVNIATYKDNSRDLSDLLQEFSSIDGDFRIRLGSTEPQFTMKGLIETMASSDKICRFLHIPLQHGSNEILKSMGRNYARDEFKNFLFEAISRIPDICVGSDIIVGFPGESNNHFFECKEFIEQLPLAYLHVFKYSKRPGTPAALYKNQVHSKTAFERHKTLTETANKLSDLFMQKQLGKTVKVLYEEIKNNDITGLTDNFIKVRVPLNSISVNPDAIPNNFIPTKLTGILKHRCMSGTLCRYN